MLFLLLFVLISGVTCETINQGEGYRIGSQLILPFGECATGNCKSGARIGSLDRITSIEVTRNVINDDGTFVSETTRYMDDGSKFKSSAICHSDCLEKFAIVMVQRADGDGGFICKTTVYTIDDFLIMPDVPCDYTYG